ncbi:MAG: Spy/CpxP family protein refolding chaperone [Kiritimatiellae bacterium]|nr:Spy/CpxP family protein refolding chaperone [Kiritimatiellia bacterium]
MKAYGLIVVLVSGWLGCVWGQENGMPHRGNRMPPPRRPEMMGPMNWVGRIASTDEFAKEVGLSDTQKEAIKKAIGEIDAASRTYQDEIADLARKQAELSRQTLFTTDASAEEIYKIIDEIGKRRTEQAKLSVKMLLSIRDILTEEQRGKASQKIRDIGRKRLQDRRQWEGRHGGAEGTQQPGRGPRREGRPEEKPEGTPPPAPGPDAR